MIQHFRIFPNTASTFADNVDMLFFYLIGVACFFTVVILVLIVIFTVRYSRYRGAVPHAVKTSYPLEITWTLIPFVLLMVMFGWGARIYVHERTVPPGAMDIHVVAKQWMWKIQHPEGQREIDELHVPTGRPIRLIMASQDVIHSFYVPAFRIKHDVVPGRFNELWFEATEPGDYHLFCAEYCGSHHSGMIGRVIVMTPHAYQGWLSGAPADEPPVRIGEKLFAQFACNTCHGQRAPTLAGVYGSRVALDNGRTVFADEAYLRDSILNPGYQIVAGYPPIMPSFQGQMTEEQLMDLISYIKSLKHATTQPSP